MWYFLKMQKSLETNLFVKIREQNSSSAFSQIAPDDISTPRWQTMKNKSLTQMNIYLVIHIHRNGEWLRHDMMKGGCGSGAVGASDGRHSNEVAAPGMTFEHIQMR